MGGDGAERGPTAAVAAAHDWPAWVHLEVGDALDVLGRGVRYDLVFADAPPGKWDGLDRTVAALAPGGVLVVDDMAPASFVDDRHRAKTAEVRERLLGDDRLRAVELAWAGGVIVASRRHDGHARGGA